MTSRSAADMQKSFKLPLLPGQSCGEEMLRTNFRKTQVLSGTGEKALKVKDVPIDFDSTGVSASASVGRRTMASTNGKVGSSDEAGASATADFEKKVLRFFGYFGENVTESAVEKSRVRRVTICYFLEDDTISVSEPRQDNSGIAFQGAMVKRHQIPRADGQGNLHFQDFAVGDVVSFYGRTYTITDCDAFTRDFMAAVGIEMAPSQSAPADAYSATRVKGGASTQTGPKQTIAQTALNATGAKVKLSATEVKAAKQFFDKDRQVLRLKAVWDDSKNLYGEKHFFTIYYFLSDDSIELVEDAAANSGRDPFPSFCRRQKIIKSKATTDAGLTFGQKEAQSDAQYYDDADMQIGNEVHIFGRTFLIYDYDKFTRDHMKQAFGITAYTPLDVKEAPKPPVRRDPPPYNGYGSEEDSLASWRSLDMKPPRKSNANFEKYGDATVKFQLGLEGANANDELRRFVLTTYLADGTIAIFESVQRNSGILGGKFLQRQKVTNTETGKPFVASDFYLGAKVTINKFRFFVASSDERSLCFMEENSSDFIKANINATVGKIQAMLLSTRTGLSDAFLAADRAGTPLEMAKFAAIFEQLGLDICLHEALTVLRYFERNGDVNLNFEVLISRLLDISEAPATIDAEWQAIHAQRTNADTDGLSVRDKVDLQHRRVEATTAAYAARSLLEQYQQRRHLFHTEFKFVTDYANDGKIGEEEFRKVVTEKLKLGFAPQQVDALAKRMFPAGSRRVTFEELLRILNNSSNYDHNLTQIKDRRE